MRTPSGPVLSACVTLLATILPAQVPAKDHPAHGLEFDAGIPWRSDHAEYLDHGPADRPLCDRGALLDDAIAAAHDSGRLVLWYVPRIEEKTLQGRQMYRAPVLDVYMRQVVFADPDVAAITTERFVPVRCTLDDGLSARFELRPLAFVEPAVVFLDGDGKVVHLVERVRTFHAQWFADLLRRVLAQGDGADEDRGGDGVATDPTALRRQGRWRQALAAAASAPDKDWRAWRDIAALQRLLRLPEQAIDSLDKADAARAAIAKASVREAAGGDIACERGLVLAAIGRDLDALPQFERGFRSDGERAAEAGYWQALLSLHLGDEAAAMRRFAVVADRKPASIWTERAMANTRLGPDDRPLGAAFTGFEPMRYLPEQAYQGLPRDTTWNGDALEPRPLARQALEFLLAQQRDDGGFTDARYAYWPTSEITPNVWVAITAIAATALFEYREVFADLQPRIDLALQRGEAFAFDPKRLNRGANEDSYSDAYRLLYLSRRAAAAPPAERPQWVQRMNALVAEAALRQRASGFFAHEYENAFCTAAVLQELLAARRSGALVPDEVTDKAAGALLSARFATGTFVYGGSAGERQATPPKDSSARMPVCEGTLFQVGRSDLDKVRAALAVFWQYMGNLEGVRRNDFHSDGELGGFFFFHAVFHASEVVHLLPEDEREAHWQRFRALLQQVPELDGSFLDSHELGRSYGTAMALLTLRNAATFE